MIINKDVIQHIRAIEAKLKEELSYDECNSFDIAKMFHKQMCYDVLKDCVLSKYCISIYEKYIFPVYVYLDYVNNYLTIDKFLIDYNNNQLIELDKKQVKQLIDNGKTILNTIN